MQKNVASQKWVVFAFNETDNTAKTGDAAQITAEISADGAAGGGDITDTNPTELEDGYYVFDITQGESNADLLLILPESSTANIQVIGVPGSIYTTEANRNKLVIDANGLADANTVKSGPTGSGIAQTANDNGADINEILIDTGTTLPARFTGIEGATFNTATDSLEVIRNDRTLPAADYVVVGDTLARVTLVDTATTVTGGATGAKQDTAQTDLDTITGTGGVLIGTDVMDRSGTLDINTKTITANAITATAINADAITNAKIADDAIAAENIATGAIAADAVASTALDNIVASDLGGVPASTAKIVDVISFLLMAIRNKQTATSSEQTITNDAGATIATAALSDVAGTTTKEEYTNP